MIIFKYKQIEAMQKVTKRWSKCVEHKRRVVDYKDILATESAPRANKHERNNNERARKSDPTADEHPAVDISTFHTGK